MYLTIQLLVAFVYTFRNFVNVYQQKNVTLPFTRVIVSPLTFIDFKHSISSVYIYVQNVFLYIP